MSYRSEYRSGGRGGYDSYHGGSRRGSPRGGGSRNYSSRGGSSNYYGGGRGGDGNSSRYQGNNYSSSSSNNYNSRNDSRSDDSYRTVRYAESPKERFRGPSSYESSSKRPRIESDRYGGSSGNSSYKGSSYRNQESSYNQNYSSSLKREYEKSKARDFMFNSTSKSSMPPPSSRYSRGSERPFRGRGRGSSRGGYGGRKSYGAPSSYGKSKALDSRYKRSALARSSYQAERLRKLKRIQQIRARRRLADKSGDWKGKSENEKDEMEDSSEEIEEEEEVEEEIEGEEEIEKENNEEDIKEEGGEESGEKATEDKEAGAGDEKDAKPADAPKKKKVVKKIVKVVKKVVKKKKKELGSKAATNGDASKDGKEKEESSRLRFKLDCPACKLSCVTYREYTLHLYTSRHMDAMKKLVGTLRAELNKMRTDQREEQKNFEETNKGDGLSTLYCEMCKLNYRQLKSEHMRSERHKKMREFLIPICKTCHMTCKSQMAYQNHICSITHLKAVQRLTIIEERRQKYRELREKEGKDVNMDNFMVLDSVGSADEDEEEKETGEEGEKKKKPRINVGAEFVKKVTAFYCELCRFYLSRSDENEAEVMARHCQNRAHMRRYVSARDDMALRKKAEKLHRELEKLNEEEKGKSNDKKDEVEIKKENPEGGATGVEESSDEENDGTSSGRRYDRFQAGNATQKLDIDDLDEKELDAELLNKKLDEDLGELGGVEIKDEEEEEKEEA